MLVDAFKFEMKLRVQEFSPPRRNVWKKVYPMSYDFYSVTLTIKCRYMLISIKNYGSEKLDMYVYQSGGGSITACTMFS